MFKDRKQAPSYANPEGAYGKVRTSHGGRFEVGFRGFLRVFGVRAAPARAPFVPRGFALGTTSEFSSKNRLTKAIPFMSASTGPLPKIGNTAGVV